MKILSNNNKVLINGLYPNTLRNNQEQQAISK